MISRMHQWVYALADSPGLRQWRKARYREFFRGSTNRNLFRGVYHSFGEAQASAPDSRPLGYDNQASVVIYESRGERRAGPGGSAQSVLQRSGLAAGFLCACSDDWNRAVAAYAQTGERQFVSAVPTSEALDELQHKGRLAQLLERLQVPMPLTRLIHGEPDVADIPQATDTFYFLKPADSQHFLTRFGTKGMRVPNAEEARRRLGEIVAAGMSVELQEYIPGTSDQHYFIDGYVDRAGSIRALFARRRLRIYPPDFGNSTAMVSVALDTVAQAADSVERVLGAVGYRGIFSAEFKRDPRDGLFKLIEVNTRPWWFVDFAVRCGVDVCAMAYADAQGLPVPSVRRYRVGATCVFPYYDFFAMQPLLRDGRLSWGRWWKELIPALQPVGCWDDPLPGVVGFTRVMRSAMRNRLRRGEAALH